MFWYKYEHNYNNNKVKNYTLNYVITCRNKVENLINGGPNKGRTVGKIFEKKISGATLTETRE